MSGLEGAIQALQGSPTPKALVKALICIRHEVDWPKKRQNVVLLRTKGALKQIAAILLATNQKSCLDLALSILGNCMMERACTNELVTQHGILSILSQLLKRHANQDSINGRTFRIVGNMCHHRDQWATLMINKKPTIVSHIVKVVQAASKDQLPDGEKISEATLVTALRALRELQNSNTVKCLVKQFGALKAVGSLFIKYSERWQACKENEKTLLDIIRVIHEYSRFRNYDSILELRSTDRGDSLVHLSSILILDPRKIVKIVMNFIKSCQLQSELPIPEICTKFIEVLEEHSIVKEFQGQCTEYLQCLCYLLDHPANRSLERCGRAIPLLIKVLSDFDEASNNIVNCCIILIHTLNKFRYDDKLIAEQLANDIIPVLVGKLAWLVGPPDVVNFKHLSEKRRKYTFSNSSIVKKRLRYPDTLKECGSSPNSSDDELEFYRSCMRSPSPGSSSDSDSGNALSWSEGGISPNRSLAHESDSDDYSPVCSEVDEADFGAHDHDFQDFGELDEVNPAVEEAGDAASEDSRSNVRRSLQVSLCHEIVALIRSYLKVQPHHPHLAKVELVMQLTKCAINEQFDVKDVICEIVKCGEHLISLMQTNYIHTLNDMRNIPANHETCSRCLFNAHFTYRILKSFSETAESGAGKGDIAHKLMRGDWKVKQSLVLVIPYIIANRSILGKLMLNCGGLDVLMKLLQENDGQDNRRSLKVLVQMAHSVLINNPKSLSVRTMGWPKLAIGEYELAETCSNVVSFRLDDGCLIPSDRDFLVKQSDFFKGLLDGHFKESEQAEVALAEVESKSFKCLLFIIQAIELQKPSKNIEIVLDLDTLLDLISLCDRFLLSDLCLIITDTVQQFHIAVDTVPLIYNWSVESGTNLLRIESVAFALVASVDDRERYAMIQKLFALGYKKQLLGDIDTLLRRYLSISDYSPLRKSHAIKRDAMREMKESLLKYRH
ncbi:uncharacterized protein LOC125502332 [Dendroctonus ponderosae]|uniref:uncharacterized protein LOC109541803 n=1 Tax=Dendroctonus ponderosae TaxID=77166 RepID=UPI002034C8BD|nr:uncharacterized protein LOC109541803 [Dendroctonus ponderosae]XP_019766330.2 uncharacterized protein LOC125502310 [Dendroctonus ponderosae]XP_048521434.1 uncharacterized protein LOC125502310 [Dendroctonus ponderosae]XP_048525562.1 uncharacterized protein LOC125502332 [Dendroctonus ponderosae]KAH0998876.1 hypothetical protein HUJ05_010892 [Dendroctonus ponderosae]KAH1008533.1 hypothetical protein HUJ05_009079 [Dendroctonus ponderosae]